MTISDELPSLNRIDNHAGCRRLVSYHQARYHDTRVSLNYVKNRRANIEPIRLSGMLFRPNDIKACSPESRPAKMVPNQCFDQGCGAVTFLAAPAPAPAPSNFFFGGSGSSSGSGQNIPAPADPTPASAPMSQNQGKILNNNTIYLHLKLQMSKCDLFLT